MLSFPNPASRLRRQQLLVVRLAAGAVKNYGTTVTEETKAEMKRVLEDIQTGRFARDFVLENKAGQPHLKTKRKLQQTHQIEEVGSKLRAMMPWLYLERTPVETGFATNRKSKTRRRGGRAPPAPLQRAA